jgi:hypothetical protein
MATENPGRGTPRPARPGEIAHPETLYEQRDLSPRAILGFLIALAIAGILMHLALWSMYKYVTGMNLVAPSGNPISTSNRELQPMGDPAVTFPAPRLQPDPVADEDKFRAYEEEVLNTYGWVNRQKGIVHIPIEQAIDVVAQQGLPTRPAATETSSTDVTNLGTGEPTGQSETPKPTQAAR